MRRLLLRFHRDTRGTMAVLAVLIVWSLVALVGMLYNTVEQTRRRQQMQAAADSAAHAATTWMARTSNGITARNMVIAQDASAEAIWRAVPVTDAYLTDRLEREVAILENLRQNPAQISNQTVADLQRQLTQIEADYAATLSALAALESGVGAGYADANEALTYQHRYRQVRSAAAWVHNTYLHGQTPPPGAAGAPPRPGPPGPNGEGLVQLIALWQPAASTTAVADYVINFINRVEMPIVRAFEAQTAYASSQPLGSITAAHRAAIYQEQLASLNLLADTVEEQRRQFADFYGADLTLATLQNVPGTPGSARVTAPYVPAASVPRAADLIDSIRATYPLEALAAGLNPLVTIDPINVHAEENRVWHPDLPAYPPIALRAAYPALSGAYPVAGNVPGGWGHTYAMPLERYATQRVNRDQRQIDETYMAALDSQRFGPLQVELLRLLGQGLTLSLASVRDLPGTLPDDQPAPLIPPPATLPNPPPPPVFETIFVLPRLTAPTNASPAFRTQVDLYNQSAARFTAGVRRLRQSSATGLSDFWRQFVEPFARDLWRNEVSAAISDVLYDIGREKRFMVLASHGLRPVPIWARDGLFASTTLYVQQMVAARALSAPTEDILQSLIATDPDHLGGGILDATYRDSVLRAAYYPRARQEAEGFILPVAQRIGMEVAAEWVRRPWAYEIEPPQVPEPPFQGLSPADRKFGYTVLAASLATGATEPRVLLPAFFSQHPTKLGAYAQAEMFNWMEGHEADGDQRYDQAISMPEYPMFWYGRQYLPIVGAPRGWRVTSMSGWDWRSRLAYSDALYEALQVNDEFRDYFEQMGVVNPSQEALNEVNRH